MARGKRVKFGFLVLGVIALCGLPLCADTIVTFPDFSSTTGLQINGNATTTVTGDGTVLRLTPSVFNQAGSAFSTSAVHLGPSDSFSTFFQFRFTDPQGVDPADGITFTFQTADNTVGADGGGLGYWGIHNSLAVEFDTYDNGPGDPAGTSGNSNHVAIDTNGALQDADGASPGGVTDCDFRSNTQANCMSNGDLWSVWIDYNGTDLAVALADGSTIRPPNLIDVPINIPVFLGQNTAYVGFTGGTGGGYQNHDITDWTFTNTFDPADSTVPEPSTWVLLGTSALLLSATRYARRKRG